MFRHYSTWKLPKSYETRASAWDDGSGININVKRKKSKSSQNISFSIIKQDDDFSTLSEIVSAQVAGVGGRDLGSITIHGFLWARYLIGDEDVSDGIDEPHRCAATVHRDFVIWMCLSPEDPDHPSSGISTSVFNKFLKSIKIKLDAYFIPTTQYSLSRYFNFIAKKLHNCSSVTDNEESWWACVKKSAEKALKFCEKSKKDCVYLAEQVEHAKLFETDEETISSNELFSNISDSIYNLRSGGSSTPQSESDES